MRDFDLAQTEFPVGLSVIEASAGTGKTWTISHLVSRFLVDGDINNIGELLLVTFTEDAARELGDRTRRQLEILVTCLNYDEPPPPDEPGITALTARINALDETERNAAVLRVQLALEESDQLWVTTIHAFCRRVIQAEPFLCGLSSGVELVQADSELRRDAVEDTWRAVIASDAVLASAAAIDQSWSVKEDLRIWNDLTRRPGTRFEPTPSSLIESRQTLVNALTAVQAHCNVLFVIRAIADRSDVRLNKSGTECIENIERWQGLLMRLTSEEPTVALFEIITKIESASSWFNRRSNAGKAACGEVESLPIVVAAKNVMQQVKRLRRAWMASVCDAANTRLDTILRRTNSINFDGLIERLHAALCIEGNRGALTRRLAARWRVGLIDESQDTDSRQLEIFRTVFEAEPEPGRLILVGDPKQAVYGFRGGDLDAYLAARPADDRRRWQLSTTFRSAEGLADALNALFGRNNAFGDTRLAYPVMSAARGDDELPLPADGQARLVVWLVADEELDWWKKAGQRRKRAAECTATAIVQLLEQSDRSTAALVKPSDVAVLTRTNKEAELVATALETRGVPAVVRGDKDVMKSEMASELSRILRAALSPHQDGSRRAALSTRLFGYDAEQLQTMSDADAERHLTLFSALGDLWRRRGIAAWMAMLENSSDVLVRLAELPTGERFLTDLRHLFELLHVEEATEGLSPELLLRWFDGQQMSAAEVTQDERLYRLDKDDSAVQVVTVHKAKGLEFDFVFCPYLWSAFEPKKKESTQLLVRRSEGWVLVDSDQQDVSGDRLRKQSADLKEEIRLAYVALTRARRRVTILAGPIGYGQKKSPVPPSGLDWLLRSESLADSLENWYVAMLEAKKESVGSCGHEEVLEQLCREKPEVISLCAVPVPTETTWNRGARADADLRARSAPILALDAWQMSSFSALARGWHEEQDHRDDVMNEAINIEASGTAVDQEGQVPMAEFPRGTRAGNCLHDLLETWDFAEDPVELVRRSLRRHRLYSDESASAVQRMLEDLKSAQLESLQTPLSHVANDYRLSEWEFYLPLASTRITGTLLAEIFARHARTEDDVHYAGSLASLPGQAMAGLLTGYIDRLVHTDQRWAVLDWKSNFLGARRRDYSQAAMWACATSKHYVLQVHLYLVALRRYLDLFGRTATARSGCVVFMRGVQPRTSEGVLEIQPPESLLVELDELFASGSL